MHRLAKPYHGRGDPWWSPGNVADSTRTFIRQQSPENPFGRPSPRGQPSEVSGTLRHSPINKKTAPRSAAAEHRTHPVATAVSSLATDPLHSVEPNSVVTRVREDPPNLHPAIPDRQVYPVQSEHPLHWRAPAL